MSTTPDRPDATKTGNRDARAVAPGNSGTPQHFIKVPNVVTSPPHIGGQWGKLERLAARRSDVGNGPPAFSNLQSGAFLHVWVTHGPLASRTTGSRSRAGNVAGTYLSGHGPMYLLL
ncbi:hypothetical protein MAC_08400 [Metarhizium acridum CQMa 102]|uniref:Uncharacterized protein n=1 Tax=Metarhizium acridum (strain CQMa 102) TaxID=655827 RepID=E9EEV2_METAQ|nr:uncharacterized protein MAC_08400 [Metarhizium acridum CQMa 102]EFY85563.1 hypothetical protein MAC_08400 [Metarhizium acridum CQMa 102]